MMPAAATDARARTLPAAGGPSRPSTASATGARRRPHASSTPCATTGVRLRDDFDEIMAGAYFSSRPGPRVPSFDYVPVSVRFGWMLTEPADAWWGHGNYEWLCDTTGAAIYSDYGHWFAGQVYYLRYNFVEPGSMIVPYSQFGLGWVLNDAYRDQTQRESVRCSSSTCTTRWA